MIRIITLSGILFGGLLASSVAFAQTIHPQWSTANGSIILYKRIGTAADILVMDPETREMKTLLSNGNYNANPSWSPNAKKVSFSSAQPDMNGSWQLYVLDVDTLESTAYTNDSARKMHTAWSPDGMWISFVKMADGNSDVYIVSADGHTERQLTFSPEREFHPKWSANSQRVMFDGGTDEARQICSVDRHGGQTTCIEPAEDWQVSTPSSSPDGKTIAFACRDADGGNICLMNSDGSEQRMIVDVPAGLDAGAPVFSSDGSQIAFHQSTADAYEIVIVATQ